MFGWCADWEEGRLGDRTARLFGKVFHNTILGGLLHKDFADLVQVVCILSDLPS